MVWILASEERYVCSPQTTTGNWRPKSLKVQLTKGAPSQEGALDRSRCVVYISVARCQYEPYG